MSMNKYILILRPKHYLKNLLIFLPLIFSGYLFKGDYLIISIFSFIIFSLVASAVYIINDLNDIERDKLHPKKKYRPISSGDVSIQKAIAIAGVLLMLAFIIQFFVNPSIVSYALLLLYIFINVAYSFGLKNIPIIDVAILSLGFVIRVYYGGDSVGVEVSQWLYLAILSMSFYLSFGKRRNELISNGSKTRKVNKYYNKNFLDKNMYMCLCLGIVSYSLWAVDPAQKHKYVFWTVPLVILIVMAYSLTIEKGESDGDPINVVTENKLLMFLLLIYGFVIVSIVYL